MAYVYYIPVLLIPAVILVFRKNERRNDIALYVSAVSIFLILALRSFSLGIDIHIYEYIFEISKTVSLKDLMNGYTGMEIGYIFLNWLVSRTAGSFRVFLIVQSLVCVSSYVFLCKKYSVSPVVTLFIICCVGMIDFPIDIIRQSLATAILIFSLPQVEKKNPWLFVAFVILASLFHKIAILFLVVFPLTLIKPSRKWIIAFSAASLTLCFLTPFLFNTVGTKIMSLFGKGYAMGKPEMREMIFIIIGIIVFLLVVTDFSKEIPRKNSFGIWPFLMSLPLLIISIYVHIISRAAMFIFFPFVGTVIPNYLRFSRFEKYEKWIIYAICVCFFAYFIFRLKDTYVVPYIFLNS